ncbi:MAG: SprT family zinc-dependent metalloprotease [bacterium]
MELGNKNLSFGYTIRTTVRARNLRINVKHDGSVVVTKPRYIPNLAVHSFVEKHSPWIEARIKEFAAKPAPLLGKRSRRDYVAHKERARARVHELVLKWNMHYKLPINTISIGNQTSRWGSCSSKKNLNFNYKIIFLPTELQDYIVVHELCHLKELNHSERFWNLVTESIPNHKILRAELKKY